MEIEAHLSNSKHAKKLPKLCRKGISAEVRRNGKRLAGSTDNIRNVVTEMWSAIQF